jgi:hypothetical protein
MVGTFDQETSQIHVAGLRDAELGIAISGLTAPRPQAQVTTDIATSSEALLVTERLCSNLTRLMLS